jgi:hypothetical protein
MPPWPAVRGFGQFSNDPSLTQAEIDMITSWTDGGMPKGAVAATPVYVAASKGADEIIEMRSPAPILRYRESHILPRVADHDRWISKWQFRPGNVDVIQAATIRTEDELLGSWVPPEAAQELPEGIGVLWRAGTQLTLDIRYRKITKPEIDRSGVALWFASSPPSLRTRSRTLSCGTTRVDNSVAVLDVRPRVSSAGASVEVLARGRDGRVEPFVVVPTFNPAYQPTYRFRHPMQLAGGMILVVNSTAPECEADVTFAVSVGKARRQE